MDHSDGSFDGSNDGPPEGKFLGDSLQEAGCGANLWSPFDEFLRLDPE